MILRRVKFFFSLLKESVIGFMDDKALKLSAALSYYTTFSLAPMLLLIISMVSIVLGDEAFEGELFAQIRGLVGNQAAEQLHELTQNRMISDRSTTAAIIWGITLLIGATGVVAEIQDSINYIWSIKAKPKKRWLGYLKNRLLSFSLSIILGFLLMVSLAINTLVDLLSDHLEPYFADFSMLVLSGTNTLAVLTSITALFTIIFSVLPVEHFRWKECLVDASITTILLGMGKLPISFYL